MHTHVWGERARERECINWLTPQMITITREVRSLEHHLGLSRRWQGPIYLGHKLLSSQVLTGDLT